MEEFSDYVGLSRPTVSRYFNDPNSVRRQTREVIEKAVKESGFRPTCSR
jgi:Transcriptional regulators